MGVQDELLTEIEAFLAEHKGMAETTFGRLAVNDGKFVRRLREGCNMTLATIARARKFVRDQREVVGRRVVLSSPKSVASKPTSKRAAPAPTPEATTQPREKAA